MQIEKTFKIKNPYRSDQELRQVVSVSDDLVYEYSNCEWIGVDTEYLSFDLYKDKLCVIQISSKDEMGNLRIEEIYTFEKEPTQKIIDLFTNPNIEKIFHVFSSDIPRIEKYIKQSIQGKIFDTKVAAKIAWTNTQNYSMKMLIKMFVDPDYSQEDTELLGDWEVGPENWSNSQVYYMMQDVLYLDVLRERILAMADRRGKHELVKETMKILPQIAKLFASGYDEKVLTY